MVKDMEGKGPGVFLHLARWSPGSWSFKNFKEWKGRRSHETKIFRRYNLLSSTPGKFLHLMRTISSPTNCGSSLVLLKGCCVGAYALLNIYKSLLFLDLNVLYHLDLDLNALAPALTPSVYIR